MAWSALLAALGLAAVIEGALYALAPESAKRAMSEFFALPQETRRLCGAAVCAAGVLIVWIARG